MNGINETYSWISSLLLVLQAFNSLLMTFSGNYQNSNVNIMIGLYYFFALTLCSRGKFEIQTFEFGVATLLKMIFWAHIYVGSLEAKFIASGNPYQFSLFQSKQKNSQGNVIFFKVMRKCHFSKIIISSFVVFSDIFI